MSDDVKEDQNINPTDPFKKQYGKFYTENYDYIFQNMKIPSKDLHFIEPFVGKGHLIKYLESYFSCDRSLLNIHFFDLENHIPNVTVQDTIQHPPDYNDAFVITNPPFLARNKNSNKIIYDMYGMNDLYKCFIKTVVYGNCIGGLIILPINFLSSIRKNDIILRQIFIQKYFIEKINIFEEQVFGDTSFSVCSILFHRRLDHHGFDIPFHIFPDNTQLNIKIDSSTFWMIGGELYNLPLNDTINVYRIYIKENDDQTNETPNTRIFLNGLDDGISNEIHLRMLNDNEPYFYGKNTDRVFASLSIHPPINEDKQRKLVKIWNEWFKDKRKKYHSLFLTNYRESKITARKRVSFQFVYDSINYLLSNHDELKF